MKDKFGNIVDAAALGFKTKVLRSQNDVKRAEGEAKPSLIQAQYADYFFTQDELYAGQNYEGRPNEELFDPTNYNTQTEEESPRISFTTTLGPLELPPVHRDFNPSYQHFHWDLERWAVFRALPNIVKMKRDLDKFVADCAANYKSLELAEKEDAPNPSLWAYYSTLPAWCREHSVVRSVLFAFEYHKPEMTLREKELAMNLACSYLRPIEGRLKEVIVQAAQSQKLRMDVTLGKQMMNELKFYAPDPATLGSDTEEDVDDSA